MDECGKKEVGHLCTNVKTIPLVAEGSSTLSAEVARLVIVVTTGVLWVMVAIAVKARWGGWWMS